MSFHRLVLVAAAALFTLGMTSLASAGCCGVSVGCCGTPTAAVVYAMPVAPAPAVVPAPVPVAPAPIGIATTVTPFGGPCCAPNGCGDCGGWNGWSAGTNWSFGGCGGCGWNGWSTSWRFSGCGGCCGGCGGCGSCGGCCARTAAYVTSPLYVVNQGPVYSGPGMMIPYQTYSPETAYAPAVNYPYVPGFGYGDYGTAAPAYSPYYPPYYRRHHVRHAWYYRHSRPVPYWRHYP